MFFCTVQIPYYIQRSTRLSLLRQSIIDITLQNDIEELDLASQDEILTMTPTELITYQNFLLSNIENIPLDFVYTINAHLYTINIILCNLPL